MGSFVYPSEMEYAEKSGIGWYRSKEPIPIKHPFVGGGYISNKKWPLIEECTASIIQYKEQSVHLPVCESVCTFLTLLQTKNLWEELDDQKNEILDRY